MRQAGTDVFWTIDPAPKLLTIFIKETITIDKYEMIYPNLVELYCSDDLLRTFNLVDAIEDTFLVF